MVRTILTLEDHSVLYQRDQVAAKVEGMDVDHLTMAVIMIPCAFQVPEDEVATIRTLMT